MGTATGVKAGITYFSIVTPFAVSVGQNYTLQLSDGSGARFGNPGYAGSSNFSGGTYDMTFKTVVGQPGTLFSLASNGNVGVGTSNPAVPLDVSGSSLLNSTYGYLNSAGLVGTSAGNVPVSIRAASRIWAAEFNATSDQRVKTDIRQVDQQTMLRTIEQLKVVNYRFKDSVLHRLARHDGFLAQQVEEVYPDAVQQSENTLPNIYAKPMNISYDAEQQTARLQMAQPHGLQVGDEVRIIGTVQDQHYTVTEATATSFTIGKVGYAMDDVFVFGKKVQDFRTLNYDRLFTLGIGAIQALSQENKTQQQSLDELKAEQSSDDADARQRLQQLEAENADLRTRLERLERLLQDADAQSKR